MKYITIGNRVFIMTLSYIVYIDRRILIYLLATHDANVAAETEVTKLENDLGGTNRREEGI